MILKDKLLSAILLTLLACITQQLPTQCAIVSPTEVITAVATDGITGVSIHDRQYDRAYNGIEYASKEGGMLIEIQASGLAETPSHN